MYIIIKKKIINFNLFFLLFKFKHNIRILIAKSFSRRKLRKCNKTINILGCDLYEAMEYLISTAIKNYGNYDPSIVYHIDHIVPLITANTEQEVIKLCHISNLQYLTAEDNLSKHTKLDFTLDSKLKK